MWQAVPPAQPTVRTPSTSESMFSRYLLFRSEPSSAAAPGIPTSSSTVNTASRGPWGMLSSSSTAMAMATAMPEVSMVRILVTWSSANSLAHSRPISANSSTSIWWLRKLSTLMS